MTANNETPKNWCEHVKDIPHFLMIWGCPDGSDEVIMFCPVCAAPRPSSNSQPEEGKELEKIAAGIVNVYVQWLPNEPIRANLFGAIVYALSDLAARKDAEIARLNKCLDDVMSHEPCKKCGTGVSPECYGCKIADLKSRIEELEKILSRSVELGKSQADEMDKFWAAIGCLSKDVSVDQAIEKWKAMEDRLKKAGEASSYWKKQFETASDGIEEMKAHKDAVIASRDALIVEKDKALAWIAENADVEDCTRCEELRNVADDSLALNPSGISSELEMLRTSHKELEADRDAISRAKFSLEADLSLATEGLERLKEELAHYGDYHWPELAEARADLKLSVEYAHHKGNCRSIDDPDDCSCGLSDILKKLRGEKA